MRFRTIKLNRRIAGLRPLDIWPSSGYGCHNSKSRDQMTMEFVTIIDRYWYKNHCWIRRRSAMNVGCEIPFTDVCEGSSTENTTLFRSDFRTTLCRIRNYERDTPGTRFWAASIEASIFLLFSSHLLIISELPIYGRSADVCSIDQSGFLPVPFNYEIQRRSLCYVMHRDSEPKEDNVRYGGATHDYFSAPWRWGRIRRLYPRHSWVGQTKRWISPTVSLSIFHQLWT
jgi:hypothetical protein